jgi:hypothetical protein
MMDKVPELICQIKEMFTNHGEDGHEPGSHESDGHESGGHKDHEGRRGKHNKFDEEQATGSTYRPASDEL